ncbi:hypothetical protein SMICM304S_02470 [Streptomyces microflavus]
MTSSKTARRPHHWRRDLIELAALFTAVAVADAIANLIGHQPDGPYLLMASAVALVATATFHTWWARRHSNAPPPEEPGRSDPAPDEVTDSIDGSGAGETVLWRMRTTVRDAPGSLAALCLVLARFRIDILTLQTHPLAEGTVDEFLLRAPASLPAQELTRQISAAGGTATWIERADAHDLVDTPTRVLSLATRTALNAAELPLALRQLLGRCTIHSLPAVSITGRPTGESAPVEGVLEETVMRLRDPSGGVISVERPYLPFTPTEFARARALVELDARLGPRVPRSEDILTLPEGNEITVHRADRSDLAAARAMHDRCSPGTLGLRYHGPVGDADRYLDHLLSPGVSAAPWPSRPPPASWWRWATSCGTATRPRWPSSSRTTGSAGASASCSAAWCSSPRRPAATACTPSPSPVTPAWSPPCAPWNCPSTTRSRKAPWSSPRG